MAEKDGNQEANAESLCRCPFCTCCFCSEEDLKRHMERYGRLKDRHADEFRRVHGRLEHGSFGGSE